MSISEKIYAMRTERNMSLREFANATGLTHTTIARLESPNLGPQKIFLDTVYQICKKLNYDFGKFLIETNYLPAPQHLTTLPAAPMGDGMTAQEQELLTTFRELSPYLQGMTLEAVRTWAKKSNDGLHKKA